MIARTENSTVQIGRESASSIIMRSVGSEDCSFLINFPEIHLGARRSATATAIAVATTRRSLRDGIVHVDKVKGTVVIATDVGGVDGESEFAVQQFEKLVPAVYYSIRCRS